MKPSDQIRWALTMLGTLAESAFYGTVEFHLQDGKINHAKVTQSLKPEPPKPWKQMTSEEYLEKGGLRGQAF